MNHHLSAVKDDLSLINHCLFDGVGIYFQLPKTMNRGEFERILTVFQDKASSAALKDEIVEAYWSGLQQRMDGNARWDTIMPPVDLQDDPSKIPLAVLSKAKLDNIVEKRPYVAFSIGGIKYLIEVFNPRNELGIPYEGAGEPVVILVLGEERFGNVQKNLIDNQDFYSIIREISAILSPSRVIGATSGNIATLIKNYRAGKITPSTNPWSFLFQLQVMQLPKPMGDVALTRYFNKFEHWDAGLTLLQVKNGIDFVLSQRSADAAKILGMVAVDELYGDG